MGLVTDALTPGVVADAATLEALYVQMTKTNVGAGWNKPTPSLGPA